MSLADKVFAALNTVGVDYRVVHHPAVYTVAQADQYVKSEEFSRAKNLLLTNHHHTKYVLLMLAEDKRFDAHQFSQLTGLPRLSFTSPERLKEKLGVTPGSVSPFGLLNDTDHDVQLYIDADVAQAKKFGAHPNDNTMTVILRTADLLQLLKQHGFAAHIVDLAD
ncbi:MAG TPA: prolyl-tRNA synthetase associated domain-containing protein [Candidatus Limosilactobacillus merdigallinarum]|uniref:Prolyl-tRNA synthetase associated domain-containing protein n=1 Tax=Candidatus Limosilactobacillus merdigallinarum TaxID=2838652 RepID=A0A9D1VGY3_9LACO|nr:prolyl-tRNA synthetase associated domain-containing protein [Candidatus Limosilactobacillus merdigallinarum]